MILGIIMGQVTSHWSPVTPLRPLSHLPIHTCHLSPRLASFASCFSFLSPIIVSNLSLSTSPNSCTFCHHQILLDHPCDANDHRVLPIHHPNFFWLLFRCSFIPSVPPPSANQHHGHVTSLFGDFMSHSLSRAQARPIFLSLSYYF